MSRVTLNEFPPEMLLLSEYTESSDVWSTAVVIWEMMAAGNHLLLYYVALRLYLF